MKNAKAILIAKASLLDGEQTRKREEGKSVCCTGRGEMAEWRVEGHSFRNAIYIWLVVQAQWRQNGLDSEKKARPPKDP